MRICRNISKYRCRTRPSLRASWHTSCHWPLPLARRPNSAGPESRSGWCAGASRVGVEWRALPFIQPCVTVKRFSVSCRSSSFGVRASEGQDVYAHLARHCSLAGRARGWHRAWRVRLCEVSEVALHVTVMRGGGLTGVGG